MTETLDLHAVGDLEDLVGHLELHDVQVPGLDRWRELRVELMLANPAPPMPNNLLERTAEELDAWAREVAVYRLITSKQNHYGYERGKLQEPLNKAMKGRIKQHASSIIEQLRPTFDSAASVMRAAVDAGVSPSDNIKTLFQAASAVQQAWLATHSQAAILDELLTTRQLLSTVAGISPALPKFYGTVSGGTQLQYFKNGHIPSGIDWTPTVINTSQNPSASLAPYNADAPWERWIAVAPHLYLNDPAAAGG